MRLLRSSLLVVTLALCSLSWALSATPENNFGNGGNETFPETHYGYVPISIQYGSAMFYGIRGDDNKTFRADLTTPLVIWLQGGPGATSQFGNFLENGPEKLELDPTAPQGFRLVPRVHRWTKHANMLYVDNPVGTGFSYVTDPAGYATTDVQIGDDLVTFLRNFLSKHTEYQGRDFWIFCESYGGKMTAYFGAALAKAQEGSNPLPINFKGVSIGDGWVDPVDCMKSYGEYLQSVSQITQGQVELSNHYADLAEDAVEEGRGFDATNYWGIQQDYLSYITGGANWYNWMYYYDYTADNQLDYFLGVNFTEKYSTIVNPNFPYNGQSGNVFANLSGAFMMDGVSQIDYLIEHGYSVNVEAGQLDLIVDVRCTERWIDKLGWGGLHEWKKAENRWPIFPANQTAWNVGGFFQNYKNFTFWQIMKAGHMIPLDNPAMAETMFAWIIGGNMSKVDPKNPAPPVLEESAAVHSLLKDQAKSTTKFAGLDKKRYHLI